MNSLINRVEKIKRETADAESKNKLISENGKVDPFTMLRRKIGLDIKNVKDLIKERDHAEQTMPGTPRPTELSYLIRQAIAEIIEDSKKLQKQYQKAQNRYNNRKKENQEKQEKLALKKEMCELIEQHINNLEMVSRNRGGGDRNMFIPMSVVNNNPVVRELPDVDNDDFRALKKGDQEIDENIDKIKDLLMDTAVIAGKMKDSATNQNKMLEKQIDKATIIEEKLDNVNIRLSKMVKDIRKGDRFLIDVILVCVLLGIGGFIYTLVK